ncbi:MAG: 3-dehydroquinate dehydratase [Ignavibacteriae bacterium]|nr:3-dehydroquinate dehydratase [Ignavibacteriota bacterium]
MKILVINGPNLNLLGKREESQYGNLTLEKIEEIIKNEFPSIYFEFYQSNLEGEIVEKLHKSQNNFDGILINPGGYTHTSVAIRDALEIVKIPKIEVHLSNVSAREDFRKVMITTPITNGYVSGFKENSYLAGVYLLTKII